MHTQPVMDKRTEILKQNKIIFSLKDKC